MVSVGVLTIEGVEIRMDAKTKRILGYVGIGLAIALVVGGAVWGLMQSRITAAEDELALTEERLSELDSQVASLTASLEPGGDDAGEPEDAEDTNGGGSSATPPPSGTESPSSEDGRHFCYVRSVTNVSGTTEITVDYAQMLTGAEAAAAAAAAGAESPPPNDYWISNVNPMLRTFPVRSGINVKMTSTAAGTDPSGYSVALGQWQDFFVGMSPGMEVVRDVPYWVTIDDGVVIEIAEQYLP